VSSEGQRTFISSYSLPAEWQIEQAEMPSPIPLTALKADVAHCLRHPIAALPLTELCSATTTVVVACDQPPSDAVRQTMLGGVLAQLEEAGVDPRRVTVLIASAMRDPTIPWDRPAQGTAPLNTFNGAQMVQHDPSDRRTLDELGNIEGVPLAIHYIAAEADLLIALFAAPLEADLNYVGGCAAVTYGLAGLDTQRELRTTRFYDDQVTDQRVHRSLRQSVMQEGAKRAGLMFALGALLDAHGRAIAVRAGAPVAVDDALSQLALGWYGAAVDAPSYDVLVAQPEGGKVRSGSLFDASLAAIRQGLPGRSVLAPGGVLVLPVHHHDDDQTAAAHTFHETLSWTNSPDALVQRLQGSSLREGEVQAYLISHLAQRYRIIIAGPQPRDHRHRGYFIYAPSMRETGELAENFVSKQPRALVVRRALTTLPIYGQVRFALNPLHTERAAPERWN
jgi:hypothetical protein